MNLRTLNFKINSGIAIVLVLVMGVSAYITYGEQKRQAVENAKAKAQLLTSTVRNIIRIDMESKSEKDLSRLINVVGQFKDIETLRIFSPDGLILYSADPSETFTNIDELVMKVFQSGDMATPFRSEEKGHMSFCRVETIFNEPNCHRCHGPDEEILGIIEVCLSMADTDKYIASNARFMMISTAGTILLVGLAISLLATYLVKRPITALQATMERASGGELDVRARISTRDEFASLGDSFNQMIGKLDESGKEIRHLHQEQMKKAERLASIGEMAASVAHEIKNPLAGLSGATHILARSFGDEDPRRKAAEEMIKLTGRLDKTINDLLKFARVNNPAWQQANPNDIIEETLYFTLKEEGGGTLPIEIQRDLDPAMGEIATDPKLLQQVLFNLIINARQACADDCTIRITTLSAPTGEMPEGHDPGDYVQIKIKDNGPGIPDEVLGEIWKPFFTTKVQGTGLGLSICRNIIEALNGLIQVSTQKDQGTEFTLWLKREKPAA